MNLLFICTHNRCRSILAEAITRSVSDGKIGAASAGSQPAGEVHPLTLHHLQQKGISTEGLHSKSWDELDGFQPDYVITVCDKAAGESCPLWLGKVPKVHWGLADPSAQGGDSGSTAAAFVATINTLRLRIQRLVAILDTAPSDQAILETLITLADCHAPSERKYREPGEPHGGF